MMGFGNQPEDGNPQDMLKQILETMQMDDEVIMARMNDQRLMQLVEYAVTRGYTKSEVEQEDLQNTFVEYKRMVKRGSMTLRDLETDVYNRWGVQEPPRDQQLGTKTKASIGFSLNDIEVADIPYDSTENT